MHSDSPPHVFIAAARELLAEYYDANMAALKSGCRSLRSEVRSAIAQSLRTAYAAEDVILFKKYMVQTHFRPGYVKSKDQALRKLLARLQTDEPDASTMERAISQRNFTEFSELLPGLVCDLSGLEVTVPYVTMVDGIGRHLESHFAERSSFALVELEDYVQHPQVTGYRAVHFQLMRDSLPYELQLKTHLQAAWARFTHDLVYKKQDTVSPSLAIQDRFGTLAQLLFVCDTIAADILKTYIEERHEKRTRIGA